MTDFMSCERQAHVEGREYRTDDPGQTLRSAVAARLTSIDVALWLARNISNSS
jgi:hypothetical protein